MKKYLLYILSALCLTAVSCEKVTILDNEERAPQITSFSPLSAPAGAEVVVEGEYLYNVIKAYIGDVPVTITQKVTDKKLKIRVNAEVKGGSIKLESHKGSSTSAEKFTVSYAVPSITASLLQPAAEMGGNVLVLGENLNSVLSVLFNANGASENHEAEIISRDDAEIVVRVPYVENSDCKVLLSYNNGSAEVTTDPASAPAINIIRYVPVFDAHTFERTAVGRSITLTGDHLDKVDAIKVGGFAANVTKSENSLTFSVPAGDFPDGETVTDIKAEYFSGHETIVLADDFRLYVPFIKFWENVLTSSHGKTGLNQSFFSPETGIAYANADWREKVDPISFKYQANTCSAALTPKVTKEEYESVNPYFFFYINNSNAISINAPSNSNSVLKNFWIGNVSGDANRLPGANGNCFGTPVMLFKYINAESTNPAEVAIFNAVSGDTLEKIDEETFPIDYDAFTIGGVACTTLSGANSDWSKGVVEDLTKDKDYDIDKVIMVLYFDHTGYNIDAADRLTHIKRIGFINVKKLHYEVDQTNSSKAALLSQFTFNAYWQKYDYNHTR